MYFIPIILTKYISYVIMIACMRMWRKHRFYISKSVERKCKKLHEFSK